MSKLQLLTEDCAEEAQQFIEFLRRLGLHIVGEHEMRILKVMANQDEMSLQMTAEREEGIEDEGADADPYVMLCVHELARRQKALAP